MSLKTIYVVTIIVFTFQLTYSQNRNFEEYNLLGVTGGVTFFDIKTDNFQTKQGTGGYGGFTTRGTVYEPLDLIYGISFMSNKVGVMGRDLLNITSEAQPINYNIQSAQITLLASINIIRHSLTIELGPILNVNGKMKLASEGTENYILDGYTTLKAGDIQDISRINLVAMGGISTGIRNFRIAGYYQYGVNNMFSRLNDQSLENNGKEFKGNGSNLLISGTIYL